MAAKYVEGERYIRNTDTQAVFTYRDRIAGLAKMEVVVADAEGNLVRPEQRPQSVSKLNPTETPEKTADTGESNPPAPKTKEPTMKPVDNK